MSKKFKISGKKFKISGNDIKAFIAADIPGILNKRYLGQMAVGALMILIGFCFMLAFRSVGGGCFPLVLGIVLVIMGIAFKVSVLRGYSTIEGTVVERTKLLPGFKSSVADGFTLLTDDNKQIHVPTTRRKNSIIIGTRLRVYISQSSGRYDKQDGSTTYGNILGYEIVGISNTAE